LVKGDLSADLLHRTITNAIEQFRLHRRLRSCSPGRRWLCCLSRGRWYMQ
jgi:hypothetical protein